MPTRPEKVVFSPAALGVAKQAKKTRLILIKRARRARKKKFNGFQKVQRFFGREKKVQRFLVQRFAEAKFYTDQNPLARSN